LPNQGVGCELPDGTACSDNCSTNLVCRKGVWTVEGGKGCAMCASPETPIATPQGERPIAELAVGDLVYSVDHDSITVVPLARVKRTPVLRHFVMQVEFANGRSFAISSGHPTADGRTIGELAPGAVLDHNAIKSARLVEYEHPYTYDILPASDTGTYFAAGVLIGSTLFVGSADDAPSADGP
jgi:hypothetical protein